MATEVKIPVPDQTTEQVRIVKWQVNAGESVAKGQIILEVETDKSVIEVEAVADGVLLQRLAEVDDMIPVGQVVGFIGRKGEQVNIATASAAPAATASTASTKAKQPASTPAATVAGVTELKIPIPDQTTTEVRMVKWIAAEGDVVAKGQVILEVETDKSVMEVEAVADGVLLKQFAAVDDMVPVGQVVGLIGPAGVDAGAVTRGGAPQPPVANLAAAATPAIMADNARIKASPVAKKLAAKLGVDLTTVTGTGPGGRIVRANVEQSGQPAATRQAGQRIFASPNARRLAKQLNVNWQQVPGTGPGGRIIGADITAYARSAPAMTSATAPALSPAPAEGQPKPGTSVKLTKMRRAIGLNLQSSSRDTPHFNVTMSIDMTNAMALREKLNAGKEKGQKISVNDLVIKACAVALKQYPAINSRFKDDEIHYLAEINIGVATAIDAGLVVPVLTDADKRDWADMAAETKRLAQQARAGKIIGAGKGTFTVSNLGMFGVDNFTAIINPPESAILAVGATKQEVVAIDGMIAVRPMMKVTLCSDHRIVDGALAAEFLRSIKLYLEEQIS